MKNVLILVSICFAAALAGCNSTLTPAQLQVAIHNTAQMAAIGCTVVQPQLTNAATVSGNADVGLAAGANAIFCTSQSGIAAATAPAASAPAAASVPAASQ